MKKGISIVEMSMLAAFVIIIAVVSIKIYNTQKMNLVAQSKISTANESNSNNKKNNHKIFPFLGDGKKIELSPELIETIGANATTESLDKDIKEITEEDIEGCLNSMLGGGNSICGTVDEHGSPISCHLSTVEDENGNVQVTISVTDSDGNTETYSSQLSPDGTLFFQPVG